MHGWVQHQDADRAPTIRLQAATQAKSAPKRVGGAIWAYGCADGHYSRVACRNHSEHGKQRHLKPAANDSTCMANPARAAGSRYEPVRIKANG